MRRDARLVSLILAVLMVGGGAGWALAHVTKRSDPGRGVAPVVTVPVTTGTVAEDLPVTATATWATRALATNRRAGVVTSVAVGTGEKVAAGDVLYAVNLVPVVVAEGRVPLFRDVGSGQRGPDVVELQRFLAGQGFYRGAADGVAGAGTASAIRAWQKALGAAVTGVVQPGEVLMVPSLPVRVQADRALRVGAELTGGESVVRAFAAEPGFTVVTSDQVAARLTPQVEVAVDPGGGAQSWVARPGKRSVDPDTGQSVIALTGADGAAVCGSVCTSVPYAGTTTFPATARLVPPVTGTLVPAAAIATDATGAAVVVLTDGTRVPVTIRGTAGGMTCVDGVRPGQQVRIPAGVGG